MILEEKQKEEFNNLVKPVMTWICKNLHPHTTVIIDGTDATLFEGSYNIKNT